MTESMEPGMKVLRKLLRSMRWDDQDGYLDIGPDGKHRGFVTAGLPQATPEELDTLFEFAGIVPNPIVSNGSCSTCAHAKVIEGKAYERGYERPCSPCGRPKMTNYVPGKMVYITCTKCEGSGFTIWGEPAKASDDKAQCCYKCKGSSRIQVMRKVLHYQ